MSRIVELYKAWLIISDEARAFRDPERKAQADALELEIAAIQARDVVDLACKALMGFDGAMADELQSYPNLFSLQKDAAAVLIREGVFD
jgi:hypothetical protein